MKRLTFQDYHVIIIIIIITIIILNIIILNIIILNIIILNIMIIIINNNNLLNVVIRQIEFF